MSEPPLVAVLGGGRSAEHEISLRSAASVARGLRETGFRVLEVKIDRDGRWLHEGRPVALVPGEGLLGADLAFPVLHGPYGEDGTVQGVLDALAIPFVGSGVAASAVCMDKLLFKDVLEAWGFPQVRYLPLAGAQARAAAAGERSELARLLSLGLPLFVKPARCGSSLGIVKVERPDQLAPAVEAALRYDPKLIVEEGVRARELECGLVEGEEGFACTPLGEVRVAGGWYDFAAKYTPGGMELSVPAEVPDRIAQQAAALAVELAQRLGVAQLARVDFFLCGERLLVNELNTMPGFTETSVYPKLAGALGFSYPELLARLCERALSRARSAPATASL